MVVLVVVVLVLVVAVVSVSALLFVLLLLLLVVVVAAAAAWFSLRAFFRVRVRFSSPLRRAEGTDWLVFQPFVLRCLCN